MQATGENIAADDTITFINAFGKRTSGGNNISAAVLGEEFLDRQGHTSNINYISGNDTITLINSEIDGDVYGEIHKYHNGQSKAIVTAGNDRIILDNSKVTGSIFGEVSAKNVNGEPDPATYSDRFYTYKNTTGQTVGNDTVILKGQRTHIGGDIKLYGGSDTVNYTAGTVVGDIDGGDDRSVNDGFVDRFNLTNYQKSIAEFEQQYTRDAAGNYKTIINFEDFGLTEGSVVDYGDRYQSPSFINYHIDKTSRAEMTGNGVGVYQINASVHNKGVINLSDGKVGDKLLISAAAPASGFDGAAGNFSNDGLIIVDTDFQSEKSDYIEVAGDFSSNNGVLAINDVTPAGYSQYSNSRQGIEEAKQSINTEVVLVKAPNDHNSSNENFSIVDYQQYNQNPNKGRFGSSPFIWRLKRSENNWVLAYDKDPRDLQPLVLAEIPVYTSLPTIGRELSFAELDRLHTRLGELRNKASGSTFNQDEEPKAGWLRAYAGAFDYSGKKGFALDGRYTGINLGFDRRIDHDNDWTTYTGIYGGYKTGRFHTSGKGAQINADTFGQARTNGWSLGAYATFFKETGTYIDLVGQYNRLKSNIHAAGLSTSAKGSALAGSIEIGHSFTEEKDWVRKDWVIEPQAQLLFTRGKWNDFNDGFSDVGVGSHTHVVGRLGVRAEKTIKKTNGEYKPWIYAGLKHTFDRAPEVSYGNTVFRSQGYKTLGEIRLGMTANVKTNVQAYVDLGYASDFSNYDEINGHAGVRVSW